MRLPIIATLLAVAPLAGLAQQPAANPRSPGPPLDLGPRTPDANAAHRGGGVILEGPPGAPAPPVMRTAPQDMLVAPEGSRVTQGQTERSTGVPAQRPPPGGPALR
jgi:hypothetical protein